MIFSINPLNLIKALSVSLELSAEGLSKHHLRTALIASKIAQYKGVEVGQAQQLIYAALLHDIGAASVLEEKNKLGTLEVHGDMYNHAETGYQLLQTSYHLAGVADIIRHHHDAYDGSSPLGCCGEDIPLNSRIISLADRIEILIKPKVNIFDQKNYIISQIKKLESTFDPDLIKIFDELSARESFWLDLVNVNYQNTFLDDVNIFSQIRFNIDDVISIADVFGTIINRMSPFTAVHSHRVAQVAEFLAKIKGYSSDEVKMMRAAGLFHDLGKLSIPNEILNKPGKLTEQEFLTIKQHTYYTYRILKQIDGFDIIAEWAAFHHETLDGLGYPFRIQGSSLKLGSRIVAVADVFTALTECRPYRKSLSLVEASDIMKKMADNNKLDGNLIKELFANASNLPEEAAKQI